MKLVFTILLSLLTSLAIAQDFSFGKLTAQDFENSSSDHKALGLNEYGLARIEYSDLHGLVIRYYYHTRIKINTKEGLSEANFSIPLYGVGTSKEIIDGIKGATFDLVDGKIIETELQKRNIISERSSEKLELTKIALPNVKEGSIIELRYSIMSPYLFNLQSWKFQDYIPKQKSVFETEIPDIVRYNTNMRGGLNLTSRKALPYDTKIETSVGETRGTKTTYVMENIPAFVEEDYMTAAKNFMAALTFELSSYNIPFGPSKDFSTTWDDVDRVLKQSDNFGRELKQKNQFKDIIPQIIKEGTSNFEKAIAVYDYIKNNIKWNRKYGVETENGIKKTLQQKNGNVADINIALICALQAANFEVNPVILSTRNNGYPSFTHPALTDFNYVIAQVKIDDQNYLLDATDQNIPFGLVPLRCINFKGRVITPNGSDWLDLTASMISNIQYNFDVELNVQGDLEGVLNISRSGYNAANKRSEIQESNSLEEYIEDFEEKNSHLAIKDYQLTNLDNPNLTLNESFKINIKNFASNHNQALNFNPFIMGRTDKNPFNLEERFYPVDLGSNIEEIFMINIKLPEGYKLVSPPKNQSVALPNRDARFLYILKENDNTISLQVKTGINKPFFLPEEYADLKQFFSMIIQTQKIDLTVSKI